MTLLHLPASSILAPAGSTPASQVARSTHSHYVPALDGIRGLAIILVMLHHFVPAPSSDFVGFGTISVIVRRIGLAGWCGVDLFFVLSGFLITGIIYDARHTNGHFRNFYIRRALRIFPLQFAVLFLVFGIITPLKPANCWATDDHRVWLWLSMANIPMVLAGKWKFGAFVHFWSLAVEEQFYFVWPFVMLGLGLSRKTLIGVCCGLLATATTLRIISLLHGVSWISLYVATPTRMDGLAVGALLALLARGPGGLIAWRPQIRWVGIIAGAALVGIIAWRRNLYYGDPVVVVAGYTLLALFFGALVALAATPGASTARLIWDRPILKFFGKYSYGIYVFNTLVLALMIYSHYRSVFHFHFYLVQAATNISIGVAVTTGIAWLSWNYFERHFLKLKRYFH